MLTKSIDYAASEFSTMDGSLGYTKGQPLKPNGPAIAYSSDGNQLYGPEVENHMLGFLGNPFPSDYRSGVACKISPAIVAGGPDPPYDSTKHYHHAFLLTGHSWVCQFHKNGILHLFMTSGQGGLDQFTNAVWFLDRHGTVQEPQPTQHASFSG